MTKLTLPITRDGKYVRRDGQIVTIAFAKDHQYWDSLNTNGYTSDGRVTHSTEDPQTGDLVSDYIEPAKGHPHAALMAQFAEDASKSETPWDQWEMLDTYGEWFDMTRPPEWHITSHYRRRPKPTPDPHAATAAEYAKDMAETDKAWKRWECRDKYNDWGNMTAHPSWLKESQYRRKEQS